MSLFDLLENESMSSFSESSNIYNDRINEIENKILPILLEDGIGESFGSELNIPKTKNVDELLKELDNLKVMKNEITDSKILKRIRKLIVAISAKIESTKFLPGTEIKKFKWKPNTPYIVLHKGQTIFGTIISAITASPFSHVDLVVNGDSYTAYDTPLGVNKYKIPDFAKVVIYELNKDVFKVNKIMEFFEKTKNTRYGFDRILRSIVFKKSKKRKEDFNAFFCSHWVISCLDYASGKKLLFDNQKLIDFGYDMFTPMTVFEFLMQADDRVIKKKASMTKPNSIPVGESFNFIDSSNFKAFKEEEEIPSGEMNEEGPVEEESSDGGYEDEGGFSDDSFGDEYGSEEEGEEGQIKDPLEEVEDSEKGLVSDLRSNMTTFYKSREADLEKILASNIGTSEYGDEVVSLIERYKDALTLFKEYLRNEYYEEATSRKVYSFIKYKGLFNTMNEQFNKFYRLLGADNEEKTE